MDWEEIYRSLKIRNWIILLGFSLISTFLMSHSFTLGIILGGLVIIINFRLFQSTIRRVFSPDGVMEGMKIRIILKYYFRLLALGIIIFILITRLRVDPVGLAIGLSTVVFSIISLGINRTLKARSREAT